ncbi:glycerate kinase [Shewanella sp. UCD-FRSSP16_17]|uniref:glycerate kinase n=1 Tax=unclassified Shewanella TaxID=196818 RepID=UPI0007EE9C42|nr:MULTISPECIES: glycerate kinase [unclassified Shewanella]MBQ4888351.1 glycerate kinase [Shewanella sp. MMG014]OBT11937.1 glycerate kinase [Shewanella sp. UCD-FRSSP16_17]
MKIVIAPDSFKESLSALGVANAIEEGFKRIFPDAEYCKVPMADGGEGTVQAMVDATNGQLVTLQVTGPDGQPVSAHYGILGAENSVEGSDNLAPQKLTAVIEMAEASGLHHIKRDHRNPMLTTSYGTGELIRDALDRGIRHIILGLGGSATNDGGAGMAQALGFTLLTSQGNAITYGAAGLTQLASINTDEVHPLLSNCQIDVACDVDNPLCGPNGASAIFGPQKGATPQMVTELDNALRHFASIVNNTSQLSLVNDIDLFPGAGAAGGMGFGVMALLDAKLQPGVDIVVQAVKLAEKMDKANLVITGEGRMDSQTLSGKTPMGVMQQAIKQDIPVIGIAGCLGQGAEDILAQGMTAIFPIIPSLSPLDDILANAHNNLVNTAQNIAASLKLSI